ncbi:MAG: hypothetical protein U9O90_08050 [Euryarchaeota archaeon]|nr:hypothetical protein [Euryarchaeota archaeon]
MIKSNKSGVIFCVLALLVLFSFTNNVFADDVDDLLSKCEIAPNPKPSAMVYEYELSPETLMPGDVGVLTITLKNMQDKPIEKDVDIKSDIKGTSGYTIDIDAETRFTMDAYIKEAHIVERAFEVENTYTSAGVIGPNEKINLPFKITAPLKEGIYMLKFIADIQDMASKKSKGIHYFIPVVVTGTVNILPQDVSENEVRLEVINEGLSDVACVYVVAVVSNAEGVENQPERMYLGTIKSGESAIAVFEVNNKEMSRAVFKAVFKHGINKHESNQVCVIIPSSGEEREKGETIWKEQSFSTPTPTHASSPGSTQPLRIPGFVAAIAFAGLLVVTLALARERRRGGTGEK